MFFALTLQTVLEDAAQQQPSVGVTAFADDVLLQGSETRALAAAFRTVCSGGEPLGLTARLDKCGVYSRSSGRAAAVAAELGIPRKADGLVAAGTPIGTDEFVSGYAMDCANAACSTIAELQALPVPVQDKLILLRRSQQWRLAHLPRVAPWHLIEAAVDRLADTVRNAVASTLSLPLPPGSTVAQQFQLPLRFGGLGFPRFDAQTASAAALSSAAVAESAMSGGHVRFRPFAGSMAPSLQLAWAQLHSEGVWAEAPEYADAACIADVLPSVQREYGKHQAQLAHAALAASCDADSRQGQLVLARLRSCASRASSMWMDVLPTSSSLTMSDPECISALRHRLGAPFMPAGAPVVRCFCGDLVEPGDPHHPMLCNKLSGAKTSRHDLIVQCWRRSAHRATVATAVEPPTARLRTPGGDARIDGSRGDLLLALTAGLTMVDVSVTCPTAATYLLAAARVDGSAAARRDTAKKAKYAQDGAGGYAFVPLSVETHGRWGKPAMQLLKQLSDHAGFQDADGPSFITNALGELSVALCKGNHIVFRAGLKVLARASGVGFCAGASAPSTEVE